MAISGLRTLPSYTGPVKLQIRFLDCQNEEVLGSEEVLGEF